MPARPGIPSLSESAGRLARPIRAIRELELELELELALELELLAELVCCRTELPACRGRQELLEFSGRELGVWRVSGWRWLLTFLEPRLGRLGTSSSNWLAVCSPGTSELGVDLANRGERLELASSDVWLVRVLLDSVLGELVLVELVDGSVTLSSNAASSLAADSFLYRPY